MKIAITGHSKGIGKALYDTLSSTHTCKGFSRSNGYDIEDQKHLIVQASLKCDVFVNNAYKNIRQVELLNSMWNEWKHDESKTIVNISSLSKYPGLSGNTTGYSACKAALSHQAFLLMFKEPGRKCRMINVNPGFVETDMTAAKHSQFNMLTPQECADAIVWAIEQPQHIEIGELSIWRPF
jgi:short-subunit dehydrogenase involved in D-alanine esterification of teichoic acids